MNIKEPSISPEDFANICYLVLMSNNGLLDTAPSYIKEKREMLTSGYDAFSYLDNHNMGAVIRWCRTWKLNIPLAVEKEWKLQCDAMSNWYTTGEKVDINLGLSAQEEAEALDAIEHEDLTNTSFDDREEANQPKGI